MASRLVTNSGKKKKKTLNRQKINIVDEVFVEFDNSYLKF